MRSKDDHGTHSLCPIAPNRRSFLEHLAAIGAGLLAIVMPLFAAAAFVSSPLRRGRRNALAEGFLPLAVSPSAVPNDGTPLLVAIHADRVDAWNKHPRQRIGTIWLCRQPDGSLSAFSSVCPHLGCAVDYRDRQRDFFCPCHNSTFSLNGQRQNRIPPRDLDQLEIHVHQDQIRVRYQRFRSGIAEKVCI